MLSPCIRMGSSAPHANPKTEGPEYVCFSGNYLMTCPAWLALPVVQAATGIAFRFADACESTHIAKSMAPAGWRAYD